MNYIFINELDILLQTGFLKKKICWVSNCSNEAINLKIPNNFIQWWYSKNNKWNFICPNLISIIEKSNINKFYSFICWEHELNWFFEFLPKETNKKINEKQYVLEKIFNKYQKNFVKYQYHFIFIND